MSWKDDYLFKAKSRRNENYRGRNFIGEGAERADELLSPGKLMADQAWGFTQGSATFYLEVGGTRLAFLGELLRFAPLQLPNPGVSEKSDYRQSGKARPIR